MTITTIIFDFGGVITSSPFAAFNRLEAERDLPQDFVRRVNSVNSDDNAWARFERAAIDAAHFDKLFAQEAAQLGYRLQGREVIACLQGDIRPEMVAALGKLKVAGYALGCITNNVPQSGGSAKAHEQRGAAKAQQQNEQGGRDKAAAIASVMARFDHVIESSKAGVRKPDPRIYQMMCDALAVAPDCCVYLDDLGINCKPAARLGMTAIKVMSARQALSDLSALLQCDLTPA